MIPLRKPIGYPAKVFRDIKMANKEGASKAIRLPLEDGTISDVDLHKIEPKDGALKFSGTSSTLGSIHGECTNSSGWIEDSSR